MPDNTSLPRKKKKNWLLRFSAVLFTLVLVGTAGYAVHFFDDRADEQLIRSAAKQMPLPNIPKPIVDPATFDPDSPLYENNRLFTENNDAFSEKILQNFQKNVKSTYVSLYDATEDTILYEKNALKKCYPASTTKLLTAIVACRLITDPDDVITVEKEIKLIGEDSSSAGLKKGMKLTFSMLMDAMMLPSGNDAAYTIAVNAARIYKHDPKLSYEEAVAVFVRLMNDAAMQIGAENSHFVNPDGWHDPDHYTTARDLAKITAYAKSVPLIAESCRKHYVECKPVRGDMLYWVNTNLMLNDYYGCYSPYCDGMKTGFTDEAGPCIISSATMDGHTLIAVLMDGKDGYSKYEEANLLFKNGFALYQLKYTTGLPPTSEPATIE